MGEYLRRDGPVSERLYGAAKSGKDAKSKKKTYEDKAKGSIQQFNDAWNKPAGKWRKLGSRDRNTAWVSNLFSTLPITPFSDYFFSWNTGLYWNVLDSLV